MANRTRTVGTGQTYASLEAALQADFDAEPNLNTSGGILTIECHFISGGDTVAITWPAFTGTPSATDHIEIVAADNHNGIWNTADCYYLNGTDNPMLAVPVTYTKVVGIQVTTTGNYGLQVQASNCVIDRCIVTGTGRHGFAVSGNITDVVFKNCLAYDNGRIGYEIQSGLGDSNIYLYNCTAVDNGRDGFLSSGTSETRLVIAKNCLGYNNGTENHTLYFDFTKTTGGLQATYCVSDDATADDFGATGCHVDIADPFTNYAGNEFLLDSDASDLIDGGTDMYGNSTPTYGGAVTTGIRGNTITSRTDIGADERDEGGGDPTVGWYTITG